MRIIFKTDYSRKLNPGYVRKTVTVRGETFTLIGSYQNDAKRWREYTLKGPGVHLHTDGVGVSYRTTLFGGGPASSASTAVPDEVWIGRNMAFPTAEARAKKIIRKALGV